MNSFRLSPVARWALCAAAVACVASRAAAADDQVVVSALAAPGYTQAKFVDGKPKAETYVVMAGNYLGGAANDPSIGKDSFRPIVEALAPELAKQEYWPAREPNKADLLLVVHWGTTLQAIDTREMLARTNPMLDTDSPESPDYVGRTIGSAGDMLTPLGNAANVGTAHRMDQLDRESDMDAAARAQLQNARMLGYLRTLDRDGNAMLPSEQINYLRGTLDHDRYFVIVQAYDLHHWVRGRPNQAVWTLRLNTASPGQSFSTALSRMSRVAADYVGRGDGNVALVRRHEYEGKVELGPLIIKEVVK